MLTVTGCRILLSPKTVATSLKAAPTASKLLQTAEALLLRRLRAPTDQSQRKATASRRLCPSSLTWWTTATHSTWQRGETRATALPRSTAYPPRSSGNGTPLLAPTAPGCGPTLTPASGSSAARPRPPGPAPQRLAPATGYPPRPRRSPLLWTTAPSSILSSRATAAMPLPESTESLLNSSLSGILRLVQIAQVSGRTPTLAWTSSAALLRRALHVPPPQLPAMVSPRLRLRSPK